MGRRLKIYPDTWRPPMNSETTCTAAEHALLQDFGDALLDAHTAARVAEHVRACASCARELQDLRAFEEAMRASHLTSEDVVEIAWTGTPGEGAQKHLEMCSVCRGDVEAVRAARRLEEEAVVPMPGRRLRLGYIPLALAATIVIGVGLALFREPGSFSPGPNQGGTSATRGDLSPIVGLAPHGDVSRGLGDLKFSWHGLPGARYAVLFFTEEGRPLARAETRGPQYSLEPEVRAKLESEAVFFWKVATLGDLSSGPESQLVRVSWKP